jgi:DNA modification methylase
LILKYTNPGETVLDPMVGSGTTCIEALLLNRNCIAVDINYNAVILTHHRLYYLVKALHEGKPKRLVDYVKDSSTAGSAYSTWYKVYHGDARKLDKIPDNSIDLVATHPPYFNIIEYGEQGTEGDLSRTTSLEEYLTLFRQVAREIYRVLKPGGVLGILDRGYEGQEALRTNNSLRADGTPRRRLRLKGGGDKGSAQDEDN